MKKNVCLLCPGLSNNGGLERVICNLANELDEHNYNVTICVLTTNFNKCFFKLNSSIKYDYLPQASYKKNNIFLKAIGKILKYEDRGLFGNTFIRRKVYFPKKMVHELEKYLEEKNFDCIIAATCYISMQLSCIDRKNIKSKLIGWQHNSFKAYFNEKGKYCFGMEKLASKLYNNLDKLVVLTEKDKNEYINCGVKNCEYIYNPLSFKSEDICDTNQKNLIFVGRFVWQQKGLDYLIEILNKVFSDNRADGWNITMVGDGVDKGRVIDEIKKNNLEDRFNFVGETNDVQQYYLQSSILLNTSRWEGFGLVITEAMECGLPVVAFETDGPNEIIYSGKNGYVISKYNIDIFAEKILSLIADNKLRENMSKAARERAMDFESEKIVKNWESLISSI